MLSRWLHRGGLGQMLAPDPTFIEEEEKQEKTEFAGGIWDILAPDPNFVNAKSPKKPNTERPRGRPSAIGRQLLLHT